MIKKLLFLIIAALLVSSETNAQEISPSGGGGNGSMTYPAAGVAVSNGSAWGTPISSSNPLPVAYGGSPTVNAASYAGTSWTDKVAAANSSSACTNGCTIVVDDSLAGSGMDNSPTLGANVNLKFTGSGTFVYYGLYPGSYSHIDAGSARLQCGGSGCAGLAQTNTVTMQVSNRYIVSGGIFDCNNQTGATGIYVGNHAATTFYNPTVVNCTDQSTSTSTNPTGPFVFYGTQFAQVYSPKFYGDAAVKIYSTSAGGGGQSNSFYDLIWNGYGNSTTPVGVLLQNLGSTYVQEPNYFYNPTIQKASVAGMAQVNSTAWLAQLYVYGGAPEVNGGGAASASIDGATVYQASTYVSFTELIYDNVSVQEATITPVLYGKNSSILNIKNPQGYGNTSGQFTETDSTSTTVLNGVDRVISGATFGNVLYDVWNGIWNQTAQIFGLESYTTGVVNSPTVNLCGSYESSATGPTYAQDCIYLQNQIAGGANGASQLVIGLANGTSGYVGISAPAFNSGGSYLQSSGINSGGTYSGGGIFYIDSSGNLQTNSVSIGTSSHVGSFNVYSASSHSGQATCWTTNGQVGYCTSVVAANGSCSCTGL